MEVENVYDNKEKVDKGYRRYLGFSNTNALVMLEKKEQKTGLQLMDYKTGKMQSVMPAGTFGEISGASLLNTGRDVLIEAVRGDSTDIGVMNLESRRVCWVASYITQDILTYGSAAKGQGLSLIHIWESQSRIWGWWISCCSMPRRAEFRRRLGSTSWIPVSYTHLDVYKRQTGRCNPAHEGHGGSQKPQGHGSDL